MKCHDHEMTRNAGEKGVTRMGEREEEYVSRKIRIKRVTRKIKS